MDRRIIEAIDEYKKSQNFEDDCNTVKSEYILKKGFLPDDYIIEERALKEKEKELLIEKECREKGHDFSDGEIEAICGKEWLCCRRCGKWIAREKRIDYD